MEIGHWIKTFSTRALGRDSSGDGLYSYSRNAEQVAKTSNKLMITGLPELASDALYSSAPDAFRVDTRDMKDDIIYLSNTHYVGAFYDGSADVRKTNYISHCFQIRGLNLYPIELYGSDRFRKGLTKEEDSNPQYLEDVDSFESTIDGNRISDFLKGNTDILCLLLECLLNCDDKNKVIIYDEAENIPMWLAAVQLSLPLQCAKQISFSTFCSDPFNENNYMIRCVPKGFNKEPIEEYKRKPNHYFFDMVDHDYPKTYKCEKLAGQPIHKEDLTEQPFYKFVVKSWYYLIFIGTPEQYKFIGKYPYKDVNSDIKKAVILYNLLIEEKEWKSYPASQLADALEFLIKYGNSEIESDTIIKLQEGCLQSFYAEYRKEKSNIKIDDKIQELDKLYDQLYQISIKQASNGDCDKNKCAKQLLHAYFIEVMRNKIFSADHADRLKEIQKFMSTVSIKNEIEKLLQSPDAVFEFSDRPITYRKMPHMLAENCTEKNKILEILELFAYQYHACSGNKENVFDKDISEWINLVIAVATECKESAWKGLLQIEEIVKNSSEGYTKFIQTLWRPHANEDTSSENKVNKVWREILDRYSLFLIKSFPNPVMQGVDNAKLFNYLKEKDLMGISGSILNAELKNQTGVDKQVDTLIDCFTKYFKNDTTYWEEFSKCFSTVLDGLKEDESEKNNSKLVIAGRMGRSEKKKEQSRTLIKLFNGICEESSCKMQTEGFESVIEVLADSFSCLDRKLLYDSSVKDSMKKLNHNLEKYCRENTDNYRKPKIKKLRRFIYLYRLLNLNDMREWKELYDIYIIEKRYIEFDDSKETAVCGTLICNMIETTKINNYGYHVLLKQVFKGKKGSEVQKKILETSFRHQNKLVLKRGTKTELLAMMELVYIAVNKDDLKSVLENEVKYLKPEEQARLRKVPDFLFQNKNYDKNYDAKMKALENQIEAWKILFRNGSTDNYHPSNKLFRLWRQ